MGGLFQIGQRSPPGNLQTQAVVLLKGATVVYNHDGPYLTPALASGVGSGDGLRPAWSINPFTSTLCCTPFLERS